MGQLNPDKLYKCYGELCYKKDEKHPGKHLKKFSDKGKNYCSECYKIEEEERRQMAMLLDTVKRCMRTPYVPPSVKGQIKNFKNNGMTLKNIRLTLDYFVNIRGGKIDSTKGIAIVPYVVDDMKLHYQNKAKQQGNTSMIDKSVKRIKMQYPKRRYDHQKEKMIDMEELTNAIRK